jgi:UDP-N-acetylglucosamine 3-dehydrogenase
MNVAIIGCGGMGRVHARMAANCGLRVVACADTVKSKATALAGEYGAEAVDPRRIAERADVDIVAIATPTPNHTEYVVAAARAGKHIFCEKPFGRTVEQCKEAIDAVKKAKGVKLFVGHVLRYFQEFEAIKAQIEAGKVGRVGFVRTYRGGIYPRGEGNWFGDFEQSGGVTLDCIIHDFDWLRYVFGEPETVFSQNLKPLTSQFIDYALVTFKMKSGIIVNTTGTWAHPSGFRVKVEVCGDGGMLTFDSAEAPLTVMMRETEGRPGMIVPGSPVDVSPYQLEWQDFLGWIEGKGKPRVTPQDALAAVKMALGALQSAESGKEVRL